MQRVLHAGRLIAVNLTLFVSLLLVLECSAGVAVHVKNIIAPGDAGARPASYRQKAHEGHQDWVWQHLVDAKGVEHHYRVGLWEPADYRSPTLNVVGSTRRSVGEETRGKDAHTVFVFGGSTVWGMGVKDAYTIPSFLHRADEARSFRFVNYGVSGYQSTQQSLRLGLLLASRARPDVVIFYDGANDVSTTIEQRPGYEMGHDLREERLRGSVVGVLETLYSRTNLSALLGSLHARRSAQRARAEREYALTPDDLAQVEEAAQIHLDNLRYVRRLGHEFGFRPLLFLQPILVAGYEIEAGVVTDFERRVYDSAPTRWRAMWRRYYERMRASGEILDLSQIFVEAGRSGSYFDLTHLGPAGNRLVAEHIYAHLRGGG